jgi:ribosomal protein S27AE
MCNEEGAPRLQLVPCSTPKFCRGDGTAKMPAALRHTAWTSRRAKTPKCCRAPSLAESDDGSQCGACGRQWRRQRQHACPRCGVVTPAIHTNPAAGAALGMCKACQGWSLRTSWGAKERLVEVAAPAAPAPSN